MKILITGSDGMLGTDIIPIFRKSFHIVTPSRAELDVTEREKVHRVIGTGDFDYVVHLAALTDLDWCEDNPNMAMKVNAEGTKNIAEMCDKTDTRLIYISTSGVFSGRQDKPYTEDDIPKPANVYGKSKYMGEQYVQQILSYDKFLILRVGWLFGGGENDKKFVGKMFKLLKNKNEVFAVNDILGSPNYSVDIGNTIVDMINMGIYGIFHIPNSGEPASRYDIAIAMREIMQVDCIVLPVSSDKFPTRAFRPPMEAICSKKFEDALGYKLGHWKQALEKYLNRLEQNNK